jgi:Na+-translocating ferredoxin:NAD+ oxidoreductase RnfG subunit
VSGEAHGKASLLPGGEKLGYGGGMVEMAMCSYDEAGLKAARVEEGEDSLGLGAGIDESATALVYEDIGILSDRTYRQPL